MFFSSHTNIAKLAPFGRTSTTHQRNVLVALFGTSNALRNQPTPIGQVRGFPGHRSRQCYGLLRAQLLVTAGSRSRVAGPFQPPCHLSVAWSWRSLLMRRSDSSWTAGGTRGMRSDRNLVFCRAPGFDATRVRENWFLAAFITGGMIQERHAPDNRQIPLAA